MKTTLLSRLLSLALLAVVAGCGSGTDVDPAASAFSKLSAAESGTLKLELYTRGPLEVGRNEVAYRLVDTATNTEVTHATLTQKPLMTMTDKSHTCPVIEPATVADAEGRFSGGTMTPTMPSGDLGTWSLDVDVLREGETTATTLSFGTLPVTERAIPARKDLVVGDAKYIVMLNFLYGAPKVGSNDVIVTVHQPLEMGWKFVPQTGLAIKMTPEMPTMGHGSSGNVDPAELGNGEYRGTVNFSMAGAWRLTFDVSRDGVAVGQVVYEFTL